MCPPAAPQVCVCPGRRANRSHLRKLPHGPGPRWCRTALGCPLDSQTPRVTIVQHSFQGQIEPRASTIPDFAVGEKYVILGFKWLGNCLDKNRSYQFKKPLDNMLRSTLVRFPYFCCCVRTTPMLILFGTRAREVTFNTKTQLASKNVISEVSSPYILGVQKKERPPITDFYKLLITDLDNQRVALRKSAGLSQKVSTRFQSIP